MLEEGKATQFGCLIGFLKFSGIVGNVDYLARLFALRNYADVWELTSN